MGWLSGSLHLIWVWCVFTPSYEVPWPGTPTIGPGGVVTGCLFRSKDSECLGYSPAIEPPVATFEPHEKMKQAEQVSGSAS